MDYEKLKLKAGLEIHFQLNTKKLFCSCPSTLREDKPDIKFKRFLRPVASEVGEKDIVAEYEQAKGRYAIYEAYSDTTCLLELDEQPPNEINKKALEIALQISLLLNAKIEDQIYVMRKQVLDFSNTSGFQRTMLIARNGYIETSKGKVKIDSICLEEDAARKIEEHKNYVVYRLDRLFIPLIEITTAPDIKTPEQAKEVAETLGMIVRSTGSAKRGIGTIRQDLNVSIKNGARVEIKGVQDLKFIPDIIKKEVERQSKIKVKEEVRKVNPDNSTSFLRPMPGAARMYVETDIPSIKIDKTLLKKIKLPELITEKIIKLEKKYNLNAELAREILDKENKFSSLVNKFKKLKPSFIAQTLIEMPKDIKSRYNKEIKIDKEFEEILNQHNKGNIPKDAVFELLVEKAHGKKLNFDKYKIISLKEVEEFIKNLVKEKPNVSFQGLMGLAMAKYRGLVDGKKIAEILKKYKS